MIYLIFIIIIIFMAVHKYNDRNYILKLPYYLLILDFIKVLPYWDNIDGYNGLVLFSLIFYVGKYYKIYFIKFKVILRLFPLFFLFLIYIGTRTSFDENAINYITRLGLVIWVITLIPIYFIIINKISFFHFVTIIRNYLLIYISLTVIYSILKIGPNMYNTGIIYGLQDDQVNGPAIAFVFYLFFNNHFSRKILIKDIAIFLFTFIILFFTFKRTPLTITLIGTLIYFLIIVKGIKKALLLIAGGLILFSAFYYYDHSVEIKRDKFTELDTEKEGRFVELINIFDINKQSNSLYYFGNGMLFNTRGKYNLEKNDLRPIHSYYGELLLGAGIIGLIGFIAIIINIILLFYRFSFKQIYRKYVYFIIASLLVLIFTCFSGQIRYVGYNGLLFCFIGIILNRIYTLKHEQYLPLSNSNKK